MLCAGSSLALGASIPTVQGYIEYMMRRSALTGTLMAYRWMLNSGLLPCTVQVLERSQCEGSVRAACIICNVQQGLNLLWLQFAVERNLRE